MGRHAVEQTEWTEVKRFLRIDFSKTAELLGLKVRLILADQFGVNELMQQHAVEGDCRLMMSSSWSISVIALGINVLNTQKMFEDLWAADDQGNVKQISSVNQEFMRCHVNSRSFYLRKQFKEDENMLNDLDYDRFKIGPNETTQSLVDKLSMPHKVWFFSKLLERELEGYAQRKYYLGTDRVEMLYKELLSPFSVLRCGGVEAGVSRLVTDDGEFDCDFIARLIAKATVKTM